MECRQNIYLALSLQYIVSTINMNVSPFLEGQIISCFLLRIAVSVVWLFQMVGPPLPFFFMKLLLT